METCPFLTTEKNKILCTKECSLYYEKPGGCPFLLIKNEKKKVINLRSILTSCKNEKEKNVVEIYLEDIYNSF